MLVTATLLDTVSSLSLFLYHIQRESLQNSCSVWKLYYNIRWKHFGRTSDTQNVLSVFFLLVLMFGSCSCLLLLFQFFNIGSRSWTVTEVMDTKQKHRLWPCRPKTVIVKCQILMCDEWSTGAHSLVFKCHFIRDFTAPDLEPVWPLYMSTWEEQSPVILIYVHMWLYRFIVKTVYNVVTP